METHHFLYQENVIFIENSVPDQDLRIPKFLGLLDLNDSVSVSFHPQAKIKKIFNF
jgi:hypothetical protein